MNNINYFDFGKGSFGNLNSHNIFAFCSHFSCLCLQEKEEKIKAMADMGFKNREKVIQALQKGKWDVSHTARFIFERRL